LRVGAYRVIYRIHDDTVEVFIVKVGIRRDDAVYLQLFKRLRLVEKD
jgi:mRNA-degrading endonuclease RelE of RelBE toxin-antitoxin system